MLLKILRWRRGITENLFASVEINFYKDTDVRNKHYSHNTNEVLGKFL